MEEENNLIDRAKNGEEEAFSLLLDKYLNPIYRFVLRLVKEKADADDVIQETFLKVWKNLKQHKSGQSFLPWVYAIARNTSFDLLRKRKNIHFSDLDSDEGVFSEMITDDMLTREEEVLKKEDAEELTRGVEKLPLRYREVLSLYYGEDMTFDEVSRILGRPLNTVKSQHRRTLLSLKKILEDGRSNNAPK